MTFVTQKVIFSCVDLKFIMFIQFSNMPLQYQNSANASPMCLPVYNYLSNLFSIRQEITVPYFESKDTFVCVKIRVKERGKRFY